MANLRKRQRASGNEPMHHFSSDSMSRPNTFVVRPAPVVIARSEAPAEEAMVDPPAAESQPAVNTRGFEIEPQRSAVGLAIWVFFVPVAIVALYAALGFTR